MSTILITGATGNVGAAVLEHLSADEHHLYTATKQKNTISETERWLDFEQPDSFPAALRQIDVLFFLRPPQLADVNPYFAPFIAACQRAVVKHIVFLSVQGADQAAFIPHAKIEKLIRRSGLVYTFIRPSYFMQNLTTTLREDIVKHHRLFLPAGHAPFLWVDVSDIGRAIAVVLTNWTQHQNQIYTITGNELLTFGQVSVLLSARIGYPVRYESPNPIRYYLVKRREGMASGLVLVMILLHFLPRFQKAPRISSDFTHLTGRQPNSLTKFIDRYQSIWD
ncbi:NmrA family NAD(P)-binding protein [Spirosoma arcticum]